MNRALTVLLAVVGVVASACGVGPEAMPRPLPPEASAVVAPRATASENQVGVLTELWFVDDNELVSVRRTSDQLLTDQEKLEALELGPTPAEASQGLRTAVTPIVPDTPLVVTANADGVGVNVAPDQVAVVLNREFLQLPSQEQLLILGQVVLTLATTPEATVTFVDDNGNPIGVPLPNGRLTSEPVSATDYEPLVRN